MDRSMDWHLLNSSVKTPFTFRFHGVTPPLLSKPITTLPHPESLTLEDPWVAILISSVILGYLNLHSLGPLWEVYRLMR